ncbi:MAG: LruC domain-containing protein [Bacteroidales bacterium]
MKTHLSSLAILVAMLVTWGCNKTENPIPGTKDIDQLVISPQFKFQTTKTVDITVNLPFTIDYTKVLGKVEVFYQLNDSLHLVYSGLGNEQGVLNAQVTIPAFVNELIVRTIAGEKVVSLQGTLKSSLEGGYSINFGDNIDTLPPRLIGSLKASIPEAKETSLFAVTARRFKNTQNLISNGTFDINDFGFISHWNSFMPMDGRWYITSQLTGATERAVDPFGQTANNYVLKIGSRNPFYGGVAQMIPAAAGQIITATGRFITSGNNGQKNVWIYLIPFNSTGIPLGYYSVINQNNPTQWTNLSVTATMPVGTNKCQVLLWVNNYGGDIYYDDIVVTGPNSDGDGDGVIDSEDAYPADPKRAYNYYYPTNNTFSTLAFEDNWPNKADYDFNDLVIDQRYKFVLNSQQKITDIYFDYKVRAIGASFKNGFGFMLNMVPSAIKSISGQSITQNYITLNANGTEAGQSKAVIIVTDNVFKQLPHPGTGAGVNTTPGAPYVIPELQSLHIAMETPIPISQLGSHLVNPFLIVNQDRGREIHLIDYEPTSLANTSYFGTGADVSNPAAGVYYRTGNNLPWCIELPLPFDYPIEKAKVTEAYLKFGDWAESSGNAFSNWYNSGQEGYRNTAKIYSQAYNK